MFAPQPPPLPDTLENQLPCLSLRVIVRVTGGPDELTAFCEILGNLALEHAEWDSPGMFDKAGGVYLPAAPIVGRQGMAFRAVFRDPRCAVAWIHTHATKLPSLQFEFHDNEVEFQRTFTFSGTNGRYTQKAVGHYTAQYERTAEWQLQRGLWFLIRKPLLNAAQA